MERDSGTFKGILLNRVLQDEHHNFYVEAFFRLCKTRGGSVSIIFPLFSA